MAKGRTLLEILTGKVEPQTEPGPYNPLRAKPGDHVNLDALDFRDELWRVERVESWSYSLAGNNHRMADYHLSSDDRACVVKLVPAGPSPQALLMTQYYPDEPGPQPYDPELTTNILADLLDKSGELYHNRGEPEEECYWRIGGKLAITGFVEIDEADRRTSTIVPRTFFDYHRETEGEGGTKTIQYLYAQVSGKVLSKDVISGGDKSLIMYRGERIEPERITIYGSK